MSHAAGSAQISNVQFENAGQLGYEDSWDPRYAVAWLDAAQPSYVKHSSFKNLYNGAVGVFGTTNVTIEDNIIYRSVGYGKYLSTSM